MQENICLYPNIAHWPRGIEVEIQIEIGLITYLLRLYQLFYRTDYYIHVVDKNITINDVLGTNDCYIYPKTDDKLITIKVVIDNLIQGAAGQAIHNMNIMFGLSETLILPTQNERI